MPRVERYGFEQPSVNIIKKAFLFLKQKILLYGENMKKGLDKSHHSVVDEEIEKEIGKIERVETWLITEASRFVFTLHQDLFQEFMNVIRSALEIYLRDTKEAKSKSNVAGFDSKIKDIEKVIHLDGIKEGRTDLFNKYYGLELQQGKKKVFLSYSHKDRMLAGEIAVFLKAHGVYVFLAHEDIEISKEWRDEIQRNLKSCNILFALITPRFQESVWTNQEAGYMLGRNIQVVPLIVGETNIKEFGFLEALQGIKIKEENPERSFEEILSIVAK